MWACSTNNVYNLALRFNQRNLKGRGHWQNEGIDGGVVLKLILNKYFRVCGLDSVAFRVTSTVIPRLTSDPANEFFG